MYSVTVCVLRTVQWESCLYLEETPVFEELLPSLIQDQCIRRHLHKSLAPKTLR